MTELARQKRNAYMREYRKNNKEKIKEIQMKYWERKALGQEEDLKKELTEDSTIMKELRSEKLSEKLENMIDGETISFYIEDLDSEIFEEIESNN